MLYQNEIFTYEGHQFRLLHVSPASGRVFVIDVDEKFAWPKELQLKDIDGIPANPMDEVGRTAPSTAALAKRNAAMERIRTLIADSNKPKVFTPVGRAALIKERAVHIRCSERTLHKDLRRYWQGGQTPQALLGNYHRSGRTVSTVTAGRGRSPKGEHATYQLQPLDIAYFKEIIEKQYLKDKRRNAADAYKTLLNRKYSYLDGNGKHFIKPLGEYPSKRQFRHFLNSNYSLELRLRSREGDKDFEREHRAKVGTIYRDCLGVGHFYEIDATICDVYLVSSANVNRIIGKPTYYLIIDRQSRLIVGFYIGLENASWICAMEAILSIAVDKAELCARYGVEYNPEDWPAHGVMPKEFLADRGEMISKASSQLSDNLGLTVTNVPGRRPEWKPLVECGFKLTHDAIHDIAPAYDPPSNATKRRGKHYEKDACLNLREFGNIILNAIIVHNHRAIRDYSLTLEQIAVEQKTDPISLWNHGTSHRTGNLAKYSETSVRYALLPRANAKVTAEGIEFRGCFYTCQEAITGGWFIRARKSIYAVSISFDTRSVDCIYVHTPGGKGQPVRAELSPRSIKYKGLSVAEVKFYEDLKAATSPEIEHSRNQSALMLDMATKHVVEGAKQRLRLEGTGKSRTARRADTKVDRQIELSKERNERATVTAHAERPRFLEVADVVSISSKRSSTGSPPNFSIPRVVKDSDFMAAPDVGAANLKAAQKAKAQTLEEIAQEARKKMFHG